MVSYGQSLNGYHHERVNRQVHLESSEGAPMMKSFKQHIQEIGFSGRPIRNTDPIQYMIRSILSGDMELNIVDKQPSIIKKRILRDITDITQGNLPIWMPRKFKLTKKRQTALLTQLKKY